MLNYAYTNFGGYFWMIAVAFVTYFIMSVVKKTFTPLTKKLASNEKERRLINIALGMILSAGFGYAVGRLGVFLFDSHLSVMWFVGGGLIAHYANLLIRKYKEADASAFAKAFIVAMNESNMDVSENDLPMLTEQIGNIVKVYADNNANSRKSKLHEVASGITGSVEITDDEVKELEKAIAKVKSAGIDTTAIEQAYARAKGDGKITKDEKVNLEAVIRAIHKVANI